MKYSSLYWSPMMLINVDANVTDPTSHSALLALCVAKVWYWTYTQSHYFARWNVLEVTQQHGWLVWFVTMSKLNSHANGISRDLVILMSQATAIMSQTTDTMFSTHWDTKPQVSFARDVARLGYLRSQTTAIMSQTTGTMFSTVWDTKSQI